MIINDNSFPNHVEHQKISEESWSNSSCSYIAVEPLRGGTMVRGCFASNKWASHLSCRSWYIRLMAYFPASHIRLYACLQSLSIFARPHAKPPVLFVIANTISCFSMFANMCFPVFQAGSQVALQFLTCHLDISPGRCWGPEWLPPFAPFCPLLLSCDMRKGDMLKAAVNRHSRSIKICPVLIQFSDDNPNSASISAAGPHTAATKRATKTAPKSRRAAGGIWDSEGHGGILEGSTWVLPSGEQPHSYGKWPFIVILMGFHGVYQDICELT